MEIKDRIVELRRVKASELIANPKNPRTHGNKQTAAARDSLNELGYIDALKAFQTPDGLMLFDGHLRKDITPEMMVPVLIVDLPDESDQNKALAYFDAIGAMAGLSKERLDELLPLVKTESGSLNEMMAHLAESVDSALAVLAEPVEDEIPEAPAEPVTSAGDVWILGQHRLLCGDSANAADVALVMDGSQINVAITSPPYASQRKYDEASGFVPIHPDRYVEWFSPFQENIKKHLAPDGSWFINIKEHCDDGERSLYVKDLTLAHAREWGWRYIDEFCWTHGGTPKVVRRRFKNGWEPIFQFTIGEHKFRPEAVRHPTASIPEWSGLHPNAEEVQKHGCTEGMRLQGVDARAGKTSGVSAKLQGKPGGGKEIHDAVASRMKWTAGNQGKPGQETIAPDVMLAYPSNVISPGKNREALGHSAAYPVGLPSFFIQGFSDIGDAVFDPFMGSGSTLMAADQLKRKCYGIEISPAYCDIVVRRWEKATGETAILLESQAPSPA